MKASIKALTVAPLLLCGALALADDSTMRSVTPTDAQLVKTCMEKQKTNTNVTMSKEQMKRYCKDQLKQQKATGEMPEAPPTDTPHDTPPQG
jgi:hypothetical protein